MATATLAVAMMGWVRRWVVALELSAEAGLTCESDYQLAVEDAATLAEIRV